MAKEVRVFEEKEDLKMIPGVCFERLGRRLGESMTSRHTVFRKLEMELENRFVFKQILFIETHEF